MQTYQKIIFIALQMTAMISFTSHAADSFVCASTAGNAQLLNELEAGKTDHLPFCLSSDLDALERQLRSSTDNDYNRMNVPDAQLNIERMRDYRLQRLIDSVMLDRVHNYRTLHNL